MKQERFQEIMQEICRARWQEVLDMKEGPTFFNITLRFNWNRKSIETPLEAGEIVPYLGALTDEDIFCLDTIGISPDTPVTASTGKAQSNVYMSYRGDIQVHWKVLRLKMKGKLLKKWIDRSELYPGAAISGTALKVYAMSDSSLTLMDADGSLAQLYENQEYYRELFPGVEGLIQYDHEEFPALWSWLHVDYEIKGESAAWYQKQHQQREDIREGEDYVNISHIYEETPAVRIKDLGRRSVTLELSGKNIPQHEVVLDHPNQDVIIWENEKFLFKACIRVIEPTKERADYYYGNKDVPAGCEVRMKLTHDGQDFTTVSDLRSVYNSLKPKDYTGSIFWNWPVAWGFVGGKLALGTGNPGDRKSEFLGLLSPGEERSFPIDDKNRFFGDDDDNYNVLTAQITLCWNKVKKGFEIQEGILKTIPDQEEIVVPENASEIEYDALLSAPSLKRITIHAGITRFWGAIDTFRKERHTRLDVTFLGSLQQWFDRAHSLSNSIGRLVIEGKEQDFYRQEELVIPEGVTSIGNAFFEYCQTLRSVVLPKEVITIGDHAFAYCDNLRSVQVLGPADIGPSAFTSCDTLETLFLADGVHTLGYGCLDFVTTLKSVFIPRSVTKALCLSRQNDGSCLPPVFLCEASSRPKGWPENWNLAYFDPRFGFGQGHDYYHPVRWGCQREK